MFLLLASSNLTTIESFENEKIFKLMEKEQIPTRPYPFDIGLVKNIEQVFGVPWYLAPFPVFPKGDGLTFSVNPKVSRHWPPHAYYNYKKHYLGYPIDDSTAIHDINDYDSEDGFDPRDPVYQSSADSDEEDNTPLFSFLSRKKE